MGTRFATTLETEGEDMHPLVMLQAMQELEGILLKTYMKKVLDKEALQKKDGNTETAPTS